MYGCPLLFFTRNPASAASCTILHDRRTHSVRMPVTALGTKPLTTHTRCAVPSNSLPSRYTKFPTQPPGPLPPRMCQCASQRAIAHSENTQACIHPETHKGGGGRLSGSHLQIIVAVVLWIPATDVDQVRVLRGPSNQQAKDRTPKRQQITRARCAQQCCKSRGLGGKKTEGALNKLSQPSARKGTAMVGPVGVNGAYHVSKHTDGALRAVCELLDQGWPVVIQNGVHLSTSADNVGEQHTTKGACWH